MNNKLRWTLRIALVLLALFILMRIYFRATDDFRLSNIMYDMPYHQDWTIPPLSSAEQTHVDDILSQTFSYVGKGAQSYVFVSEDGNYVIKFFKFKHLRPSWFIDILPNIPILKEYKHSVAKRKARKLYGVFNGYKLAYDRDKEESGLIFIQLNPSGKPQIVHLIDKLGFKREVDLAHVVFVLQKKGQTLRTVLAELLKKGNLAIAKERIGQIFDLYLNEYRKGVFDHDHGVMQNTGFVGHQPIHLDVGKIYYDENIAKPEMYQPDLLKIAYNIQLWLKNNFPEYEKQLTAYMEEKLSQAFGHEAKIPDHL